MHTSSSCRRMSLHYAPNLCWHPAMWKLSWRTSTYFSVKDFMIYIKHRWKPVFVSMLKTCMFIWFYWFYKHLRKQRRWSSDDPDSFNEEVSLLSKQSRREEHPNLTGNILPIKVCINHIHPCKWWTKKMDNLDIWWMVTHADQSRFSSRDFILVALLDLVLFSDLAKRASLWHSAAYQGYHSTWRARAMHDFGFKPKHDLFTSSQFEKQSSWNVGADMKLTNA